MRPRKFLLVTKALTTAGLVAACKKEDLPPPPGNPKGTIAVPTDAAPPPPPPANPKGSMYATPDAAPSATPSSGTLPKKPPPPPGNPKGTKTPAKNPIIE